MAKIDYIECDGVRVPSNWSVDQLRETLAKRKIRFANEKESMAVFGDAIRLKAALERQISQLQSEITKWENFAKEKRNQAMCPGCGMRWIEPPVSTPSNKMVATKNTKPNPQRNPGRPRKDTKR